MLTADDRYSLCNSENLPQQLQMQLSNKQTSFSDFFLSFLEFASTFQHFQVKDDPDSLYILDIADWERYGYINV